MLLKLLPVLSKATLSITIVKAKKERAYRSFFISADNQLFSHFSFDQYLIPHNTKSLLIKQIFNKIKIRYIKISSLPLSLKTEENDVFSYKNTSKMIILLLFYPLNQKNEFNLRKAFDTL